VCCANAPVCSRTDIAFTFIDYERDWDGVANTLAWSQRVNWSGDDNLDDNYSLNYRNYRPISPLSCLVTAPARSWQCGGQGFESP
jgi:hypothetical protein